jgi:hypothetical protein
MYPRAGLDAVVKRRSACPCQEWNPGRPARSTVTKLTEPSRLLFTCCDTFNVHFIDKHETLHNGYTWVYLKVSWLAAWSENCNCIATLWVSLVSFAVIALWKGHQRVIPKVSLYFISTQSGNFWIHVRTYVLHKTLDRRRLDDSERCVQSPSYLHRRFRLSLLPAQDSSRSDWPTIYSR